MAIRTETTAERTSAAKRTLAVTELREAIIGQLPSKDVVLVQRVSKIWRDTIKGSLMLQRALGFRPNGKPEVKSESEGASRKPTHSDGMSASDFLEASEKPGAYIINPLLEIVRKRKPDSDLILLPNFDLETPPIFKNILLTQPPTQRIIVDWQCHCALEESDNTEVLTGDVFEVENFEGLKIDDALSALYKYALPQCDKITAFCWKS